MDFSLTWSMTVQVSYFSFDANLNYFSCTCWTCDLTVIHNCHINCGNVLALISHKTLSGCIR
jgi:hypothetical protein